jgi:hypothetical protein
LNESKVLYPQQIMPQRRHMKKIILVLSLAIITFITVCSKKEDAGGCRLSFSSIEPAGRSITINQGKSIPFKAELARCENTGTVGYSWTINNIERGLAPAFTFYGCSKRVGANEIKLTVTSKSGQVAIAKWAVNVNQTQTKRPDCVDKSIKIVKNTDQVHEGKVGFEDAASKETERQYGEALACLDPYLADNLCDVDAAYASGLAKLGLELAKLNSYYQTLNTFNSQKLVGIVDNELIPILDRYRVVESEAPAKWSFRVRSMTISVLKDDPVTPPPKDEAISVSLSGIHDLGEVKMITCAAEMLSGFLNIGLAYNKLVEYIASLPFNFYKPPPKYLKDYVRVLIDLLESDPEALKLSGPGGKDGREYLLKAQSYILAGIYHYHNPKPGKCDTEPETCGAADLMLARTYNPADGPQPENILRFWDCGADGICPPEQAAQCPRHFCEDKAECPTGYSADPFSCVVNGDPPEPFDDKDNSGKYDNNEPYWDVNGNTKWNDSWKAVGADKGEHNGKFDVGEPFGTECVRLFGDTPRFQIPASKRVLEGIILLADNIKGPNALSFDAIIGMQSGTVKAFLDAYGIPYPEIRISEFFVNPSNIRDMLPIYSRFKRDFVIQSDEEIFSDVGYDMVPDESEVGYDINSNPDPNHDDFDPRFNDSDGYDNDNNGLVDWHDVILISTDSIQVDFGVEGNFLFDFKDLNDSGEHDPGEPSEPFDDTGIPCKGRMVGAGNGSHDRFDCEHVPPTGADIGGVFPLSIDPSNSTDKDTATGCIDIMYLFLQDPSFSGIVQFPDEYTNREGLTISKNGTLLRLFSKILETGHDLGILKQVP